MDHWFLSWSRSTAKRDKNRYQKYKNYYSSEWSTEKKYYRILVDRTTSWGAQRPQYRTEKNEKKLSRTFASQVQSGRIRKTVRNITMRKNRDIRYPNKTNPSDNNRIVFDCLKTKHSPMLDVNVDILEKPEKNIHR